MYDTLGHFGCIGRLIVSYLLRCIICQRAISGLDNARCALSRLVNAQLQAGERAFTEKAGTLHGLKRAWHRAVNLVKHFWQIDSAEISCDALLDPMINNNSTNGINCVRTANHFAELNLMFLTDSDLVIHRSCLSRQCSNTLDTGPVAIPQKPSHVMALLWQSLSRHNIDTFTTTGNTGT